MRKQAAFTVLEIVLVMALTGVLISILFSVLQRFNAAVSNEVKIKSELNAFFMMRSTIWKDLDLMDSLQVESKNEVVLFKENERIVYKAIENGCERMVSNGTYTFPITLNEVTYLKNSGINKLQLSFEWKGRNLTISYPLRKSPAEAINNYFSKKEWQNK